jgi:hypothetical protein
MKTQISQLRSGTNNQILNPEMDYYQRHKATSYVGHSGSNQADVESIWKRITCENPETMKIILKGIEVELKANWSLSRKSVSYWGSLSKEELEDKFYLKSSKKETPSISIQHGNIIIVSNGKNSFSHVCPSLIEIL